MDIAVIVGQLLGPVLLAGEDRAHLYRLLHQLLAATEVDDELFEQFGGLVKIDTLQEIALLVTALSDPDDPREPGDIVGALVPLVEEALEALRDLELAPPSDVDFSELASLLPGYLLGRFLSDQHPVLGAFLALLGTTRKVEMADGDGYELLELGEVGSLLGDPSGHVAAEYGWGRDLDYTLLFDRLERLAVATRCAISRNGDELTVVLVRDGPRLALTLRPAPPDGVAVAVEALGELGSVALGPGWTVGGNGIADGTLIELRPSGVNGPALTELSFTGQPEAPWQVINGLEISRAVLGLGPGSLSLAADARISLAGAGSDSFLAKVLGGQEVATEFSTDLVWSVGEGLSIGGTASFETVIVIERSLGPIWLHRLTIALRPAEDGVVELVLGVAVSGKFGPLEAAVDGLGLRAALVPVQSGTFGPYDLEVAFQPPSGVGLGLDVGVVSGGGYLYLDFEAGEYAGVLDFQALGVGIAAIGLIDTDSGSVFFALYLSIPSLQLGFGFTLTGLGGLGGVNRTLDDEALGAAVRAGAIDAILFPEDPVAQAPMTIDNLKAMFPTSPDRYVFGPVVRIGWGTPSLIEAEVGVVISLPDPIVLALIGSLSSVLPTEDLDLIGLHLDVAGSIDFGAGTLTIDTALHDSHVMQFALSGGMSLRATFLGRPDFLMALGGAHPGFDKPPGFPEMPRLSLAISAAPVIAIHFDCYFALATNSVQFGAAFGLSAEVAGFGIEGGSHFDALVYFSPFEMHTSIGCYVAITAAGIDLAGVWLDASLEGPNPWLVVGTAKFKLLGFEEHVRVDERIGTHKAEELPESEDLFDDVLNALSTDEAWTVVPSSSAMGVLFATSTLEDGLVAMPDGVLTVRQQAAPLNITIDKAGDSPASPYTRFELEAVEGTVQSATVQDWFAPGYFFELTSTEQLSSPSFELLDSGMEVGGGDAVAGLARKGSLDFEQILSDPDLAIEDDPVVVKGNVSAAWNVQAGDGYFVAAAAQPVVQKEMSYAVTDRDTGDVVRRTATWSAAHQSAAGKKASTAIVPSWEVPA